jgi:hypothetical protein
MRESVELGLVAYGRAARHQLDELADRRDCHRDIFA